MDCPTEEGQIRRALEAFTDIRRLSLICRHACCALTVPTEHWANVQAAIGKAGFDAELLSGPPRLMPLRPAISSCNRVAPRASIVAEAVAYAAPETLFWKLLGMGYCRCCRRALRTFRIQKGTDRGFAWPAQYQRPDVGCRGRSLRAIGEGPSGDGNGTLRYCRADRGSCRRAARNAIKSSARPCTNRRQR